MGTTGTGLPSPKCAQADLTITVTAEADESVFVYDARVLSDENGSNLTLSDGTLNYALDAAPSGITALDVGNGICFPAGADVTLSITDGTVSLTYGIKKA